MTDSDDPRPTSPAPEAETGSPAATSVLVVEDNPVDAALLGTRLERAGYRTHVAGDAETALAMLDGIRPDIVLVDQELPGMSGTECIARIRERLPTQRVVMLTGHGSVELAVKAMHLGAVEFVTKQASSHKLVALIDRITGHRRTAANGDEDGERRSSGLVDRVLAHLGRR